MDVVNRMGAIIYFPFYGLVLAGEDQEEIIKVRKAEERASRAINSAVRLRARAQLLMANADWATFKSVMASRLADAARASQSPDLPSAILG